MINKIEIDIIKQVMYSIDPESKDDPDLQETIELMVITMVNKQKEKNANKKRNT